MNQATLQQTGKGYDVATVGNLSTFEGKAFLFDKFAQYLKNEYHIVKINGQLHIYNKGIYDYAQKTIETKMIEKIPTLTSQRRTEVMK